MYLSVKMKMVDHNIHLCNGIGDKRVRASGTREREGEKHLLSRVGKRVTPIILTVIHWVEYTEREEIESSSGEET